MNGSLHLVSSASPCARGGTVHQTGELLLSNVAPELRVMNAQAIACAHWKAKAPQPTGCAHWAATASFMVRWEQPHVCRFYDGSIAHLMLFDAALEPAQVNMLYQQIKTGRVTLPSGGGSGDSVESASRLIAPSSDATGAAGLLLSCTFQVCS